jgi:hypothetical protein
MNFWKNLYKKFYLNPVLTHSKSNNNIKVTLKYIYYCYKLHSFGIWTTPTTVTKIRNITMSLQLESEAVETVRIPKN